MALVCDFIEVNKNSDLLFAIDDNQQIWRETFNTGGRSIKGGAFLIFNVRGLTLTTKNVEVQINGTKVGTIYRYPTQGMNETQRHDIAGHWHTQMIAFAGSVLRDGDNQIAISAVELPEPRPNNRFDELLLKDVMCFFHQAV